MSVLLARLKPRNPRLGLKVKDHSLRFNSPGSPYHRQWFDFRQAGVWYRVPAEVGEVLRRTQQDPYRPSPLIFDVCTEAEATELDRQARLEKERRMAVEEPSVATAVDLTGGIVASAPLPREVVQEPVQVVQEPVRPQVAQPVQEPAVGRGDLQLEDVARSRAAALQATRPPEPEPAPEPEPVGDEPSLDWTRAQLVDYAKALGVKAKKDWNKATILQAIQDV